MKKIILNVDSNGNVYDKTGVMIGTIGMSNVVEAKESSQVVVDLVKQGLDADDIVKLKNADLL